VFGVEIPIRESDEDALTARMTAMREWLDHRRVEPSSFRYTFIEPGILFRVDFPAEATAVAFARAFGGSVVGALSDVAPQTAAAGTVEIGEGGRRFCWADEPALSHCPENG
jgi:hypothetical protein